MPGAPSPVSTQSSMECEKRAQLSVLARHGARAAIKSLAHEVETTGVMEDQDLHATVCQCVIKLAGTLKPEYADALQAIDV